MGKRRHGKPDRFGQGGGFSQESRDVDASAVETAVMRFVATFVLKSNRKRAQRLLLGRPERLIETLQELPEWVEPSSRSDLDGNTGFPQHVQKRFGDLRGVLMNEHHACSVTIAGAVSLSSGGFGALFVADSAAIALLIPEFGAPTLCMKGSCQRRAQ